MPHINRRDLLRYDCRVRRVRDRGVVEPCARVGSRSGGGCRHDVFLPGVQPFKVPTTGAIINGVVGGEGPPVLLLHGAPQPHHLAAGRAEAGGEVHSIVSDLRGYDDSSKPADGEEQANYSKCAMALDQGRGDAPWRLLETPGRPPPGGHNLREDVPEMVEEEFVL